MHLCVTTHSPRLHAVCGCCTHVYSPGALVGVGSYWLSYVHFLVNFEAGFLWILESTASNMLFLQKQMSNMDSYFVHETSIGVTWLECLTVIMHLKTTLTVPLIIIYYKQAVLLIISATDPKKNVASTPLSNNTCGINIGLWFGKLCMHL